MTEQATATQVEDSKSEKTDRLRRGSAPPTLKLSDAADLAKKINERAAGSASYDLFSQITGNTKTSSTFVRKLAALRQYGIIEDRENVAALTEIGYRIAAPRDTGDDTAAIKEALLRIDTLNKIFERHRGRLLPEDQFLKNILIQELKVPRELADTWVEYFRDAASAARLLFQRTDGKTQVLEGPSPVGVSAEVSRKDEEPTAPAKTAAAMPAQFALDSDRLVLIQLGRGRLAKLELPTDWNTEKDLVRLLKMLKLSLSDDIPEGDAI